MTSFLEEWGIAAEELDTAMRRAAEARDLLLHLTAAWWGLDMHWVLAQLRLWSLGLVFPR